MLPNLQFPVDMVTFTEEIFLIENFMFCMRFSDYYYQK